MPFGQQSGPPATARQTKELLGLLEEAGHRDFRDARGPMGFNQRQAAGKFTRDEAAAFIDLLRDGVPADEPSVPEPTRTETARQQLMRQMPAEDLADELRRRGWTVTLS